MIKILYLIPFILILILWVKDDIQKALYMIVITELIMSSSYLFFGASPRNLFVPYALCLGIIKFIKDPSFRVKLPTLNSIIFFTIFVYYLWISIVQIFIHGYSIFHYRFHIYLGKSLWFVFTAFLIQYFITDEKKLKTFINVIIFFCAISAVIGIGQVLFGGIFVDLRNILQKSTDVSIKPTQQAFGLQFFHIPFAYDMLMGAFLSFPILTNIKTKKSSIKNWLLFLIIFGGLIFSMTRSAIGAFFVGILVLVFFLRKRFIIYPLIIVSISVLLISQMNIHFLKRNTSFERIMKYQGSLNSKLSLHRLGLRIVWKNPFGIGHERFENYVKENSNKFDDIPGWQTATITGVHNHFLLNIIYFGWIAGFISVLLIIELFAACRKIYISASSEFKRLLIIVISAFLVAYNINIFFHHAGLLKGDVTIWIVSGILLSLNNIMEREKAKI